MSGCNIGIENPLRMVLTGCSLNSRKVCCGEFLRWIFLQNNSSTDGLVGRRAIIFAGSQRDVYKVCDHKKGAS